MLGLAFPPDHAKSGHFFVYYTRVGLTDTRLSRFSTGAGANQADPNSELVIMDIEQPFDNHNGGMLIFGPDGMLYLSLGDGGPQGDPFGNGQNPATLLGSVLRISVNSSTPQIPYEIPPDNPFFGSPGQEREEIWAYGLRNPWKLAFDPNTNDLWAADVGHNDYEEIDVVLKGGNYGWNIMEGFHCYPPGTPDCNQTGLTLPIWEYTHAEGCSVTGGYIYRGTRIPALDGAYIYGDWCAGKIWALRYDGQDVTEQGLLVDSSLNVTSFGEDEEGNLYIMASDGRIYRLVDPNPALCNGQLATIIGTAGPETIVGTPNDDVIVAHAGNDVIVSLEGSDTVCAGDGSDLVLAGDGVDTVFGGAGNDILFGGNDGDRLIGGSGGDRILGQDGDDLIVCGPDTDLADGGPGTDFAVQCEITVNIP